MGIVSATEFRSYGPAASFVDVSDDIIDWYLDATEKGIASQIGKRGYEALTIADLDFVLAVFKLATWDLMVGVRGVNPADAGHMALKMQRDEAAAWVKDVARGVANISGTTPTRKMTGTARVFSSAPTNDDGTQNRGW